MMVCYIYIYTDGPVNMHEVCQNSCHVHACFIGFFVGWLLHAISSPSQEQESHRFGGVLKHFVLTCCLANVVSMKRLSVAIVVAVFKCGKSLQSEQVWIGWLLRPAVNAVLFFS